MQARPFDLKKSLIWFTNLIQNCRYQLLRFVYFLVILFLQKINIVRSPEIVKMLWKNVRCFGNELHYLNQLHLNVCSTISRNCYKWFRVIQHFLKLATWPKSCTTLTPSEHARILLDAFEAMSAISLHSFGSAFWFATTGLILLPDSINLVAVADVAILESKWSAIWMMGSRCALYLVYAMYGFNPVVTAVPAANFSESGAFT